MTIIREEIIGDCRLILGDSLAVMAGLGRMDHMIFDPPYEATLHAAKNSLKGRKHRNDGVAELKGLDFAPIDAIRADVVALGEVHCDGWFIAFCTPEGIAKWADQINASPMKYKRACVWIKPDSTPQLNGQGPAQGAENLFAHGLVKAIPSGMQAESAASILISSMSDATDATRPKSQCRLCRNS